jgi:predicted DNA-binding transcriptional regulator YafY
MTARQLADELEVSVRTIYRDVESLHGAGVPLYGDAGPSGGYQLLDGYRTKLTGLTEAEAESLFLAGLPGPAAELGLGEVVTATHLKLMAALPDGMRDRAERIAARFHLDAPGWYADTDSAPFLAQVAEAVWQERTIDVTYVRWRSPEEVTRTLQPYGLVLKGGRWYLVARQFLVEQGSKLATYRVSQIRSLTLGERFDRPDGFDLAAHWHRERTRFEARRFSGEAVVRLTPRGRERFADVVTHAVARDAETGPDGTVTVPTESVDHALGLLLCLGTDVEVLEPPELRARFVQTAQGLAEIYLRSPG